MVTRPTRLHNNPKQLMPIAYNITLALTIIVAMIGTLR